MKELSIKINDELFSRASANLPNLEAAVNQRVTEYLEAIDGDEERLSAARAQMAQLFRTTTNFGVGTRPSREEMHEGGSKLA